MKHSNKWHTSLYDTLFAKIGLDSKEMHSRAEKEARFVARATRLPTDATILDIPCGTGRHAKALSKLGYAVTGVDINSDCLKLARKNCPKNVSLKRGDMKKLSWARGKFDAVINMFTSFGYFSTDSENEAVLGQMVNCLKPDGRLVIQTINREFLLTIFDPARWGETQTYYHQEATRYDPKTKYVESQKIIIEKGSGRGHRYYHRARLYSAPELKALMRKCGLSKIKVYGDADGNKLDRLKSSHPIYIGTKRR